MEGSESYRRLMLHPTNGKIFLPINIDGIESEDNFITIPKLLSMAGCGVILALLIGNAMSGGIPMGLAILLWLFLSSFVFRYIVFEEKRYYKAYMQTKKIEICTPAEFFNITAVRETPAGSIIVFKNGKVGVLIKFERGTIVGRAEDFMGEHYDAMAEMFRELLKAKLNFIIFDLCESTGNEGTVDALGRLTVNSSSRNINKLMELQIGFIKTIVNDTIYTKDYLLVYTDAVRVGTLISECEDALRMTLDGAIDNYEMLDQNGISVFVSEYFGVGFFSGEEVLREGTIRKAFKVVGIEYTDGIKIALDDTARGILDKQVKGVDDGKFLARQVSLRKALAAGSDDTLGLLTEIDTPQSGVLFDGGGAFATQPIQAPGNAQNAFGGTGGTITQNQFGGQPGAPSAPQTPPVGKPLFGGAQQTNRKPVQFGQPQQPQQVAGPPKPPAAPFGQPQQGQGFPKQ